MCVKTANAAELRQFNVEKVPEAIVFILNETAMPKLICLLLLSFLLLSLSVYAAPSLISELRAEKIEQKSITLAWRKPSYPNSSRTEYEVKYYEKVSSDTLSVLLIITAAFMLSPFYSTFYY